MSRSFAKRSVRKRTRSGAKPRARRTEAHSGICKRFLTRRLQKLHSIVIGMGGFHPRKPLYQKQFKDRASIEKIPRRSLPRLCFAQTRRFCFIPLRFITQNFDSVATQPSLRMTHRGWSASYFHSMHIFLFTYLSKYGILKASNKRRIKQCPLSFPTSIVHLTSKT